MTNLHDMRFPNESPDYRKLRNQLLEEEIALRQKLEDVAKLRRELPAGGELKENYVFEEISIDDELMKTGFSDLFEKGKPSLLVYSFMFPPDAEAPCPACTSMIDGLNGSAAHIRSKVNFVVVAKAPIEQFKSWADSRHWNGLRLLSSNNNTYNSDYFGESEDGQQQLPTMNVFQKTRDGIVHTYSTELLFTEPAEHQHPRHADLFWPIWALFDLTPEGRGDNWFPRHHYD